MVHNTKYDYSLVEYNSYNTKVNIICTVHGMFEQTPHKHMMGKGCRLCGGTKQMNSEIFINKAKLIQH